MEIASAMPVTALDILPDATGAGLDINVAAAAGTGYMKPAVKEAPSVATDKMAAQRTMPTMAGSEPARIAQNVHNMRTGNNGDTSDSASPAEAVKEYHLNEYMHESAKRAGGGDPSTLFDSTMKSLGEMVESAQDAMGPRPQDAVQAPLETDAASNTPPSRKMAEADMQHLLDQYVSASWALFGASLATNSVSAAASSVNTLIKQQ